MTSPAKQTWWRVLLLKDVPFWTASRWRRLGRLLVFLFYAQLGVVLVLLALENRILYPGAYWPSTRVAPSAELGATELTLYTDDGVGIHAWWLVPPGWEPKHGAVLFSHGNGYHLAMGQGGAIPLWRDKLRPEGQPRPAVLAYDYPGYGKSQGRPSEAGCYAAAHAAYHWLIAQQVPPSEIILVGESLGTAMATELAVQYPHRLLVLVAPFTSIPDMAQRMVVFLPVRWLVRNQLDTRARIGQVLAPVLISHGDADSVVPFDMGQTLYEAAPEPKRFYHIPGGNHMHPMNPAFFAAVREMLETPPARK